MLAIIQTRYDSSRLPGKALSNLGERSVLGRTIDRLSNSEELGSIVIATSILKSDQAIVEHAEELSTEVFRGSLEDVGERLLKTCLAYEAEAFVRISGDSPLIDWRIVDHAIRLFRVTKPDLVTNIFQRTFPKGQSVEIIKTNKLAEICGSYRTKEEKEHVTPYFYKHFNDYKILSFTSGSDSGNSRQCIDDEIDLRKVERLVLAYQTEKMSWSEIETLMKAQPPKGS